MAEDGKKKTLVVLCSRTPSTREQGANQDMTITICKGKGIIPELIWGTDADMVEYRKQLFGVSGIKHYPQFFLRHPDDESYEFLGDFDHVKEMNDFGEFTADILNCAGPPCGVILPPLSKQEAEKPPPVSPKKLVQPEGWNIMDQQTQETKAPNKELEQLRALALTKALSEKNIDQEKEPPQEHRASEKELAELRAMGLAKALSARNMDHDGRSADVTQSPAKQELEKIRSLGLTKAVKLDDPGDDPPRENKRQSKAEKELEELRSRGLSEIHRDETQEDKLGPIQSPAQRELEKIRSLGLTKLVKLDDEPAQETRPFSQAEKELEELRNRGLTRGKQEDCNGDEPPLEPKPQSQAEKELEELRLRGHARGKQDESEGDEPPPGSKRHSQAEKELGDLRNLTSARVKQDQKVADEVTHEEIKLESQAKKELEKLRNRGFCHATQVEPSDDQHEVVLSPAQRELEKIRSLGVTKTVMLDDNMVSEPTQQKRPSQAEQELEQLRNRPGVTQWKHDEAPVVKEAPNAVIRHATENEVEKVKPQMIQKQKPPVAPSPPTKEVEKIKLGGLNKVPSLGDNAGIKIQGEPPTAPRKEQSKAEKELEELRTRELSQLPSENDATSAHRKSAAELELEKIKSLGVTKALKQEDSLKGKDETSRSSKERSKAEKELEALRSRGVSHVSPTEEDETTSPPVKTAAELELEKIKSLGLTRTVKQDDSQDEKHQQSKERAKAEQELEALRNRGLTQRKQTEPTENSVQFVTVKSAAEKELENIRALGLTKTVKQDESAIAQDQPSQMKKDKWKAEKELEELRNRGFTKAKQDESKEGDAAGSRAQTAAEKELEEIRSLGVTKTLKQEDVIKMHDEAPQKTKERSKADKELQELRNRGSAPLKQEELPETVQSATVKESPKPTATKTSIPAPPKKQVFSYSKPV